MYATASSREGCLGRRGAAAALKAQAGVGWETSGRARSMRSAQLKTQQLAGYVGPDSQAVGTSFVAACRRCMRGRHALASVGSQLPESERGYWLRENGLQHRTHCQHASKQSKQATPVSTPSMPAGIV